MRRLILFFSFLLVCLIGQAQTITTLTYQVDDNADDYAIRQDGSTWEAHWSTSLLIGNNGSTENRVTSGARFTSVAIPQGATIVSARLIMRGPFSQSYNPVYGKIKCELVDNATNFTTFTDFRDRYLNDTTTAVIEWNDILDQTADTWDLRSPDFSVSLQEVIDRPGWTSGNAFVVFFGDYDGRTAVGSGHYRISDSHNNAPANAPQVEIKYFVPGDNNGIFQIGTEQDTKFAYYDGTDWNLNAGEFGSELAIGYFNSASYRRSSGMCFRGVSIPQGSTIDDAKLFYHGPFNYSQTVWGRLSAEDVDDSTGFTDITDWNSRFPGGITTAQHGPYSVSTQDHNTIYETPSITSVLQEVVNRPGWASGNDLTIFFDDYQDNTTHNSNAIRAFYSYSSANTNELAPKLFVEWTPSESTDSVSNWFFVP